MSCQGCRITGIINDLFILPNLPSGYQKTLTYFSCLIHLVKIFKSVRSVQSILFHKFFPQFNLSRNIILMAFLVFTFIFHFLHDFAFFTIKKAFQNSLFWKAFEKRFFYSQNSYILSPIIILTGIRLVYTNDMHESSRLILILSLFFE